MKYPFSIPLLWFALLTGTPALSADYQTGVEASLRRDFARAFQEWEPLAQQGDASSQFQLGWLYMEGHGVQQDLEQGVKWYMRSAEQGYAFAQTALGRLYEGGRGVQQNYPMAYMWYSVAASSWDKDAHKDRDRVAQLMTSAQRTEGQQLIQKWNAGDRAQSLGVMDQ